MREKLGQERTSKKIAQMLLNANIDEKNIMDWTGHKEELEKLKNVKIVSKFLNRI